MGGQAFAEWSLREKQKHSRSFPINDTFFALVALHRLPFDGNWEVVNPSMNDLNAIKAGSFNVNVLVLGAVNSRPVVQGNCDFSICDTAVAAQDVQKAQGSKDTCKFTAAGGLVFGWASGEVAPTAQGARREAQCQKTDFANREKGAHNIDVPVLEAVNSKPAVQGDHEFSVCDIAAVAQDVLKALGAKDTRQFAVARVLVFGQTVGEVAPHCFVCKGDLEVTMTDSNFRLKFKI